MSMIKAGAAVGYGARCGAAGAGEVASSLLLSQRGCDIKGKERWSCGSAGHVLDVKLINKPSGTKEDLLSLVFGGGIVPPVIQSTFAALRCPPMIPTYYRNYIFIIYIYIMGNNIFPCIMCLYGLSTLCQTL